MKNNYDLRMDVLTAIKDEQTLCTESIAVSALEGSIVLSGTVDNYIIKIEAVDTTRNVRGVTSVTDNIEIQYGCLSKISDDIITSIVLNAIKWNWEVPYHKVDVKVKKGQVTLEGLVQYNYQKKAAECTTTNLAGVKCIINNITIGDCLEEKFLTVLKVEENFQNFPGKHMDSQLSKVDIGVL